MRMVHIHQLTVYIYSQSSKLVISSCSKPGAAIESVSGVPRVKYLQLSTIQDMAYVWLDVNINCDTIFTLHSIRYRLQGSEIK